MISKFSILLILVTVLYGESYGQIVVPTTNGYNIIDISDGERINKYSYPFIDNPSEGLCLFYSDGYFGYHEKDGNVRISNRFDIAYPFKKAFALVGKSKRYFYINEKGEKFGDLDWPKAPVTYKDFLILEDSISKVIHKNGATVLETPHQLITTPYSGIMEWNQDSGKVNQYISLGYGQISKLNHFQNVTDVATTWQGYACVVFDSTFSIYNDRGEEVFSNQPKQSLYLPVKIVWNKYLYLPTQLSGTHFENAIHQELLYYSDDMYRTNGRNVYGPSVLLGQGFEEEDVALLRGTEKWVIFDRSKQTVEGSYLFDAVLPSDENNLLLVRQNMEWKIYSRRMDTLISTGYRYVHDRGLLNGMFLGSNDNAPYKQKKWSLNFAKYEDREIQLKIGAEQIYQFPMAYYFGNKLYNPQVFNDTESADYLFLLKDDKTVVINGGGKEIYRLNVTTKSHLSLENLFMPKFYLQRSNVKKLENKKGLNRNGIGLYLEVENQNLEITLSNTSKEGFYMDEYDYFLNNGTIETGLIEVYLEYESEKGKWQKFSQFPGDAKTDFKNSVLLAPNQKISERITLPKGAIGPEYNIRAVLVKKYDEIMYSNTIRMSLAPALLYGNPYFEKYGALTKYQLFTH